MSQTSEIIVESKIDKKIYLDFFRFNCFYMNKHARNSFLFPLLLLLFAIFNWFVGSAYLGWILFVLALITPIWILITYRSQAEKQIRQFDLNSPKVFYTISFSSNGIYIRNKKEKADYNWDTVYSIYRTSCYMYLYLTKTKAFIIPFEGILSSTPELLWQLFTDNVEATKLITKTVRHESKNKY
jgi:hypothetical protein